MIDTMKDFVSYLLDLYNKGGPVMIPLLFCSLLGLAIVLEKFFTLRRKAILRPPTFEAMMKFLDEGMIKAALKLCVDNPGILDNIVASALENRELSRGELREVVKDTARQEIPGLERYLGLLGIIASVSPLLGLLGTVTGMIKVFRVIAEAGLGQIDKLSNGISEALITTATGLSIAIPAFVLHRYFQGKAERIILELERITLGIMKNTTETREDRDNSSQKPEES